MARWRNDVPPRALITVLFDFEVRSCRRVCCSTGRDLAAGDAYFSVLQMIDGKAERYDYCAEAWQGPPAENIGWWRSRVPQLGDQPRLAPAEVLLNLFVALAQQPQDSQFRYVLGLMLVRKRLLRHDGVSRDELGNEVLGLFATKRNEQFELLVDEPDSPEQVEQIQRRMIALLYGDGEATPESDAA